MCDPGATGIGMSRLLEELHGLTRLSGMAVIRLSMHAYYRPAGDCACTATILMRSPDDLGAVENIARDFGDANPNHVAVAISLPASLRISQRIRYGAEP